MRLIHLAIATLMVAAILVQPLRGEWWVICKKPGMEVIDIFWLLPGGYVEVLVDTRERYGGVCLKLKETTDTVPGDLVRLADIKESQATIEGESVDMVTVSLESAVIKAGFTKQKYTYDFQKRIFELRQVELLEIE